MLAVSWLINFVVFQFWTTFQGVLVRDDSSEKSVLFTVWVRSVHLLFGTRQMMRTATIIPFDFLCCTWKRRCEKVGVMEDESSVSQEHGNCA